MTTLQRIHLLYEQEQQLLNHDPDNWQAAEAVRQVASDIREELAKLWPKRRAEQVFRESGPPRMIGGGTEADQKRAIAHGIQPLPGGA